MYFTVRLRARNNKALEGAGVRITNRALGLGVAQVLEGARTRGSAMEGVRDR